MADPNPDDHDRFRHAFARQLSRFDAELSDCRQMYESLPNDDRQQFRAWLEKVIAIQMEGEELGASIFLRIEFDEMGDDGNVRRWADVQFSPQTVLSAIGAWDAGDDFAPPGVPP